jgi:predicted transposase YdaD
MNRIEKNIWAGMQYFKIDEKIFSEGMEKGILEGMEKGKVEGMKMGKLEGKLEGIIEGLEKGKFEFAKRALLNGLDIKTIALITALDEKVIKKLAREIKKHQNI